MSSDVRSLLVKLGIDKDSYANAVDDLDAINEASHDKEKARQAEIADALRNQLNDQLAAISTISDAKERQVAATQAIQDAADQAEIEMMKQKMEQQEHLNDLRKEAAKQHEEEQGGGGLMSKLGEAVPNFISNLTGSSGLGGLAAAGGIFAGVDEGIHLLVDGFEELGSKIKEMVMNIGPLQNQLNTLDHLLSGSGESAQQYLGDLAEASHDLVGFTDLLNFANRTLLQNTGLSKDQIKDLVGTVTDYSRSIGKDAVGSLNELSRALTSGRLNMLAYRLELDPAIKDELNMTSSMEKHARIAMETQIVMGAMQDSLEKTGPPIWTITDAITSLYNRFVSFEDIMGKDIAQSSAFNIALEGIYAAASAVGGVFESLFGILSIVFGVFDSIFKTLTGGIGSVEAFELVLASLVDVLITVNYGVSQVALGVNLLKNGISGGWKEAWATFQNESLKNLDEFHKKIDDTSKILYKPTEEPKAPKKTGPSAKYLQEVSKMQIDLAKESAQIELDIEKEKIDQKKALNDEYYKHGQMTLQEYVDAQKKAAIDEYNAEASKIDKVKQLQIRELQEKAHPEQFIQAAHAARGTSLAGAVPQGKETAETGADENYLEEKGKLSAQIALIDAKADDESLKRKAALQKELLKYDKMIADDAIAAEKTREEAAAAIGAADRKRAQDNAEFELKMGMITGEQLIAIKKDNSIAQEAADVEAANRKFKFSPDSQNAQAEREAAIAKAHEARVDRDTALDRQQAEDHKAANAISEKSDLALAQARQKALEAEAEWEFSHGEMTAEQILKIREDAITAEKNAAIAAAQEVFDNAEDKEQARATLAAATAKAEQDAADKAAALQRNRDDVVAGDRKKRYQDQVNVIQAQGAAPGASQQESEEKLLSLAQERLDLLEQEHSLHYDNVQLYQQEEVEIAKLKKDIQDINADLDVGNKDVASLTSTVAGLLNRMPATKGFGQIFGDVSGVASAMGQWSKTAASLGMSGESGGVFGGVARTAKEVLSPSDDTDASERVSDFAEALKDGVSAVGSFITAITSAKSAAQGIVGGGMAGASLGSSFGPIGTAIGAGVGALLGGLFGHWKAELQTVSTNFTNALADISQSIQNNTMSLATGVAQAQQERQDLITQLSGMKGGKSQLQQMLPQINQQIDAMLEQQKQEVLQFMNDYQQMTAPLAYQPIIGSMDTILQKFQEYSSALGTATDAQNTLQQAQQQMAEQNQIANVMGSAYKSTYDYQEAVVNLTNAQNGLTAAVQNQATAQQYLNAAVNQYVQQQQQQLAQADQQAVQDALNLNDALIQRAQLIQQTNQEEYNVLSQGSLTREMTSAQSKMEQLDLIKQQTNQQLETMNAQIQVEQFRVSSEQTIFNLATTRIALETQLVALQEGQITLQTANLQALSNVVTQLSSGNPNALLQVLAQLGYNTAQLPAALQQSYNTQASLGLGGYYGSTT